VATSEKITNDEEMERCEKWLTEHLIRYEDPLCPEKEKADLIRRIEIVSDELYLYKYGWDFRRPQPQPEAVGEQRQPQPQAEPVPEPPEQSPTHLTKKNIKLSAFLDDDD